MRYLIITVFTLLIFAACKKVETPASREEEMRNGKWKRSNLKIKFDPAVGFKDTLIPYYDSVMLKCKKDDYIIFGTNRDATLNAGEICENAPEPESIPFYWSLEKNKTRITILNANEMFFDRQTIDAKFDEYGPDRF